MNLFVNVRDSSDCINVVAEMTIERLGFGAVFFVESGAGFWRRHWGHSLKVGKVGAKFYVFRIDNSCANIGASVEVKRNWVSDSRNFGAVGGFLQAVLVVFQSCLLCWGRCHVLPLFNPLWDGPPGTW